MPKLKKIKPHKIWDETEEGGKYLMNIVNPFTKQVEEKVIKIVEKRLNYIPPDVPKSKHPARIISFHYKI
jgi:hypothetical protein